jgi:hypothetical protein
VIDVGDLGSKGRDWEPQHPNVHRLARTAQASPIADYHGFMVMFIRVLYGPHSGVRKLVAQENNFPVDAASQHEVSKFLPNFHVWADLVINKDTVFDLVDLCGTLAGECCTATTALW